MDVAWDLVQIGPAAIPALTKSLKDKDADVRFAVAFALKGLGPAAVPLLAQLLRDEEEERESVHS